MNRTSHRRVNRPRLETLEGRQLLANAGTPKPNFGDGTGYASISIFNSPVVYDGSVVVSATSVVTTPSGQILESGTIGTPNGGYALAVVEFNANGSPDTSFGTGGIVEYTIDPSDQGGSKPVTAVQPNGQIIEALIGAPGFNRNSPLIVFRLNVNGSLDSTFGTNGVDIFPNVLSATSTGNPLTTIGAIVVQANNQILLVGSTYSSEVADSPFAVMRLNANGSVDTTYGEDGVSVVPVPAGDASAGDSVAGAALQSNGQLVVVGTVLVSIDESVGEFGTGIFDVGVIRLNTDGTLDTSFGGSNAAGIVLLPSVSSDPNAIADNMAHGMAIDSNDKILISGYNQIELSLTSPPATSNNTLYRLNSDGTLDTTFGTNGLVTPLVSGQVVAQADGSIDVAGLSYPRSESGFVSIPAGPSYVVQFNAAGSPVTNFGNSTINGIGVFLPWTPRINSTSTASMNANINLAIEPTDGDIVVAGPGTFPSLLGRAYDFTVVSLIPAASSGPPALSMETQPASFDGSGQTNLAVYDPANGTLYYRPTGTTGSQDVADPFGSAGLGQSIPAAADYQGTGKTQVAVYLASSGVYAIQPTATSPGLFMQFGVAGAGQSIPVPADYYGTGQADVAVYLTASGTFAIQDPTGKTAGQMIQFGAPGLGQSIPAPADYYGTGQADIAVYLAQFGTFAILAPGGASGEMIPFGKPGLGQSIPVPGDYDGSGHIELAVYVPSVGAYFYQPYGGGAAVIVPIGIANSGEIPVPGDYDGSGRTEVAIYDPTLGFFEYKPAKGGPDVMTYFGTPNNGTLPAAASAGALPAFAAPGSGSGNNAARAAFVPSGTSGSVSAAAITSSSTQALPSGPTLASLRVALSLVNQGDDSGLRTED